MLKGGYLSLTRNIQKAKKDFKTLKDLKEREVLKELPLPFLENLMLYLHPLQFELIEYSILLHLNPEILEKINRLKEPFFEFISHLKVHSTRLKTMKEQQDFKFKYEEFMKYEPTFAFSKQSLVLILENLTLINAWLSSLKFKEKYQNHPYPPLLDPDILNALKEKDLSNSQNLKLIENYEKQELSYEKLPANIAWELNLPLPRDYKFIWTYTGSEAGVTFYHFLHLQKISFVVHWYGQTQCEKYKLAYELMLKNEGEKILNYTPSTVPFVKLYSLFDKNVPRVHIARCPLEKIQHSINHVSQWNIENTTKHFNLTFKYESVFPTHKYHGGENFPTYNPLHYEYLRKQMCCFESFQKNLPNNPLYILDFNKFKPDFIEQTLNQVIKDFNLKSLDNMEIFKNRLNRNRGTLSLLPLKLYAHNSDIKNIYEENKVNYPNSQSLKLKNGFTFIITLPHCITEEQKEFKDITQEYFGGIYIDDTQICILMEQNEWKNINQALKDVSIKYLHGFIQALKNETLRIKNTLIYEDDILHYLKSEKELALEIKKYCDEELISVKKDYPHIVDSWKYFKEFEKICEEILNEKKEN